jgi:hypothetical protein
MKGGIYAGVGAHPSSFDDLSNFLFISGLSSDRAYILHAENCPVVFTEHQFHLTREFRN